MNFWSEKECRISSCRMRWKFRLGVSLKLEKNFNTILRADYGLDIFALMTSALLTVLAASLGLVEP